MGGMNHYNEKMAEKNTIKCGDICGVVLCIPGRAGVYNFIRGIKERVTIYSQVKRWGSIDFIRFVIRNVYFVSCLQEHNSMVYLWKQGVKFAGQNRPWYKSTETEGHGNTSDLYKEI